jgi:hypothetical protein
VNDIVTIKNVTCTENTSGEDNFGFNGTFKIVSTPDSKTFTVNDVDTSGVTHFIGNPTFDALKTRSKSNPTFSRNDIQENLYVYRVETITSYIKDIQDGIFYLYVLNANNAITQPSGTFEDIKYSQKITDLYPQLDRDNFDANPPSAVTFAKRTPLGDVVTNDLKRSITRETTDKFFNTFSYGNEITDISDSGTSATLTLTQDHGLCGITGYTTLDGGTGHTDGTYYNVRLINDSTLSPTELELLGGVWNGATASLTVTGGVVEDVTITEFGAAYKATSATAPIVSPLYFDVRQIGGTPDAHIDITASDIVDSNNDYIQVTGIGTAVGGYYKISAADDNKKQISIAKTAGDPQINPGEYVTVVGKVGTGSISNNVFSSSKGVGVVKGNKVRLLDGSNNNLGDYIVSEATATTFTISSTTTVTGATQFMKHALSDNNASADSLGENIGTRLHTFYDNQVLYAKGSIGVAADTISVKDSAGNSPQSTIESRFPLGSYIQINNEIMRVKSSSLTGTNNDEIQVIRGSMGTIIETHDTNSLVKKITLSPIELRRPSILRASAHTFEYLGYGPGNYSTGLPQVQVKTLSENEEFLSQSQETAGGTVLYTGMDSDGDFYIGNTKYSAQSGEQKTFDVPTPTVTGEDPNRLSVVFDEVVVKERILVEGGKSKQILSQFDGPVTFNANVRFANTIVLKGEPDSLRTDGRVHIKRDTNPTSCNGEGSQDAALRVDGGVAIGGKLMVCEEATFYAGIVPDIDEGAYIGTTDLPWSVAHIGEIQIAPSDDNTVTTATGKLILDSAEGTVDINDQLTVSGITTFENVQDNTIGDANTGAVQIDGGVGINKNVSVGAGLSVGQGLSVVGLSTFFNDITVKSPGTQVTAQFFRGQADAADQIKTQGSNNSNSQYITFVGGSGSGNKDLRTDSGLSYVPSTHTLSVDGDIIAYASSDERLKDNVTPIDDPLAKVISLGGYTFDWNENSAKEGTETGVIAQEVENLGLPGLVTTRDNGYKAVRYEKLVPLLIEAIKELSDKVSTLEKRLDSNK